MNGTDFDAIVAANFRSMVAAHIPPKPKRKRMPGANYSVFHYARVGDGAPLCAPDKSIPNTRLRWHEVTCKRCLKLRPK